MNNMKVFKILVSVVLLAASSAAMAQTQDSKNTATVNPNTTSGAVASFDSHNVYQAQERNPVSSAFAPALSSGFDTCMGSTSGAVSSAVVGVAFGKTYVDKNCQTIKNARELWNMGQRSAALARMCMDDLNREAMEATGFACPVRKVAVE
jgi:hypothetical protein